MVLVRLLLSPYGNVGVGVGPPGTVSVGVGEALGRGPLGLGVGHGGLEPSSHGE